MKISYNWLKQFIKIDWDAEKMGELLTNLGLEVSEIVDFEFIKGGLRGVVVGHITSCWQHPNADKLKITKVNIGTEQEVQIICGATNVDVGQRVLVATVGTVLYDKEGKDWKIKTVKIRGEESSGMICSEQELGLGKDIDGIMVLEKNWTPGTPAAKIFAISKDQVFEIDLTPNRADAMSHFGVARDVKAGLLQQEINLKLITPPITNFKIENRTSKIKVHIEDSTSTLRYCGVTLSGIKVKASPLWLQNRLKSIGLTPVNNIVDATNYVLHELGQPLHAFDANKIADRQIIVKTLPKGTKFVTLDGTERTLHEEDLMICDSQKPLCIAGVFGGLDSGITEYTTELFLESAYFDPVTIRKTAKRHGLNTDASFRFERGIDIHNVSYALKWAVILIQELAGGIVTSELSDFFPKKIEDHQVFLIFEKVDKLVGQKISRETIKSILFSLGIKINNVTEVGINLTIPSYRVDVQRESDVIEEILRIYGYNRIKFSGKMRISTAWTPKIQDYKIENIVGNQLVSQSFYEILTNSLTTPAYTALSESIQDTNQINILNPLSKELSTLRQSNLFSGLEVISHNINHKRTDLKFFEFGKTYHNTTKGEEEYKHLSLLVSGNRITNTWIKETKPSDFFYFKGVIDTILERLGISISRVATVHTDIFKEGIYYGTEKKKIVDFGIVNPYITKSFGIKQEVLYADFYWNNLLYTLKKNPIKFKEISKFPIVKRDLALLVDENISFDDLYRMAIRTEKKLLKKVLLFDVYTGDKLPKNKKSYALSFILQNEKGTLTEKQIHNIMNKLENKYKEEFKATLR